jgi:hypothetical protein
MAQEFTIKSNAIEDKINQLLPSQGGQGAGIDFSASTMVIPVVDLTETAEGSGLRQDLQTAISHANVTAFNVQNAQSQVINTTGYWQLNAAAAAYSSSGTIDGSVLIFLSDGTTNKVIFDSSTAVTTSSGFIYTFYIPKLVIKLEAGDSLYVQADDFSRISGSVNQIADINGNLT